MKFRWLALATLVSCGAVWAATVADTDAATAPPSAPDAPAAPALKPIEAGKKSAGIQVTAFAPSAYFNQNCARCHGENGAYYPDDMGKDKDDAALRATIDDMANGPGNAPLAPADLNVVTAWHRALSDKKPFVALVKAEKVGDDWQLSGEVSPGATLQINGEAAKVDGVNWTYKIGAKTAKSKTVKLRAQKGEAVTELDANVAAFAP